MLSLTSFLPNTSKRMPPEGKLTKSKPAVLRVNCEHCYVPSFFRSSSTVGFLMIFQFRNYASKAFTFIVGKKSEIWPFLDEVAVRIDRVGLRQFFFYKTNNGL